MAWVLYLGNAGQVLYQTGLRGCRTVWCGEGPPDESAKVWSGVRRVKLVIDLIEEEFRLERLPHLTGSDHRALVRRKQRQLFQAEPLVTARRLGRERSGRRDDLILFTAVRGVRVAETWLDWLAGRGIAVGGFWSLPQMAESGLLPCRHQGLRLLPYPCGDRILLRQNYLQEGRLVFSRLSQLPKADFAAGVAEEVERTWRYLLRLLGLAPESGVSLQVAATLTLMEALVEALTDLPGVEVTGLKLSRDLPELAARCLGCRPWRRPDYRLYRFPDKARLARAILYGGAIASMAAASAFAGFVWKETGRLERARQDLVREESRLADQLARLPSPSPVEGLGPPALQSFFERHDRLERFRIRPAAILIPVSAVLDHFPELELQSLAWERAKTAVDAADDWSALERQPVAVTLTLRQKDAANLRQVRQRLRNLLQAFAARDGVVQARLLESSLPVAERAVIQGEVGRTGSTGRAPVFRIQVLLRTADATEEG